MPALRADRIADPAGGSRPGVHVVEDGRIAAVLPPDDDRARDATDLGDVSVLPGLVDAHLHLAFDASRDVLTPLLEQSDEALAAQMAERARALLAVGVTTARDLGDRRFLSLDLREALRADVSAGPELLVAGPPLTRTRGHCWFLGGEADTEEELRAAVRERAARLCDVVKVMVTGGVITPGFGPHESQYGAAEVAAVVDEAHRHGLPVAAHAHGPEGIRASVEAGVDTVEHCSWFTADGVEVDWDVVDRVLERGVVVSVTLGRTPGAPPPPPAIELRLDRYVDTVVELVRRGVPVVCGTDGGIGPGKPHTVLPHAVLLLVQRGVPFDQALAAATSAAADACRVGDRKGRLVPGHDADLLVVRGDPWTYPEALLDVHSVHRAGVRVA